MDEFLRAEVRADGSIRGWACRISARFFRFPRHERARNYVAKLLAALGGPGELKELQLKYKAWKREQKIAREIAKHQKYCPGEPMPPELEQECQS
jgi:hypothetical protein